MWGREVYFSSSREAVSANVGESSIWGPAFYSCSCPECNLHHSRLACGHPHAQPTPGGVPAWVRWLLYCPSTLSTSSALDGLTMPMPPRPTLALSLSEYVMPLTPLVDPEGRITPRGLPAPRARTHVSPLRVWCICHPLPSPKMSLVGPGLPLAGMAHPAGIYRVGLRTYVYPWPQVAARYSHSRPHPCCPPAPLPAGSPPFHLVAPLRWCHTSDRLVRCTVGAGVPTGVHTGVHRAVRLLVVLHCPP